MKKVLKTCLAALGVAFLFLSCDDTPKQNGLVPIEIWYTPYTSLDKSLPDDWFGYGVIEQSLGVKLTTRALPFKKEDQTKFILEAARRNALPDYFMVDRELLVQLAKENKIARVDKMFDLMPIRTSVMYDKESRRNGQFDGLTYGLCQAGAVEKNEGIFIRKDWLDNLGLQIPVTLDDFINVMNAFTYNDPDGNGLDDTYGFGAFIDVNNDDEGLGKRFAPFFGAYGVAGVFNSSRGNLGLNIHKPEFFEAMSFVRRFVTEKVIDPQWTKYRSEDFREAWENGRFGIMREHHAYLALEANYENFDEKFPNGEWLLINPPVGPNGKSSVGCYKQSYRIGAVSKRTAELGKLEALAKVLEWMSSDGYNMVAYGLLNVNHKLTPDGKITYKGLSDPTLAYTKKKVAPILQLRNMVFHGGDDELVARYPTWYTKAERKVDSLSLLREMQRKSWTPVTEIPDCDPELREFMRKGLLDFITGERLLSKDEWDSFLAEFDKRGGKKWEKASINWTEDTNSYIN